VLSHIIIPIHIPSITKNYILKVSFDDFTPLQHDNPRNKSSFRHHKKLHFRIVIEHGKPHGVVHDKNFHNQGIIWDLRDLTALSINYCICLCIFSHKNILKCKIQSVHYTRSPKDVRIFVLYNSTRGLTCRSVISYDFYDILRTNFFNAIFKFFSQCNVSFSLLSRICGEHRVTFGNRHEINERSSLRIRPSITTNGDPLLLPCGPDGLHQPLHVRFFTLQESDLQRVVPGRFVVSDWIVCGKFKCLNILWIPCQIKW